MVLLVLVTASLCLGNPVISPFALGAVLADDSLLSHVLLVEVRAPRVVAGFVAGGILGAAGFLMQQSMRNPLAVPEVLGVSAGSAFVVATVVVWGLPVAPAALPLLALFGGLGAASLTVVLARGRSSATGVVLVGMAVSAGLVALMLATVSLAENLQVQSLFRYLNGSLNGIGWAQMGQVAPWLVPAAAAIGPAMSAAGVLRTGDATASGLGAHPGRARLVVILATSLLLAPVVALCGPISWTAFLAPIAAARLIPASSIPVGMALSTALGSVLVLAADLGARFAFVPVETPVGAWTAIFGVLGGAALLNARSRNLRVAA